MFYFLTAAVKRKFIGELRDFWAQHPKYQGLVDNIQGKYAFDERPQYGIILKAGSANQIQFSPQNFVGVVQSYFTLAGLPGYSGASVEWVREDVRALHENGGESLVPPGIYYCEVGEGKVVHVDPLLEVQDEPVTMVTPVEGMLQTAPYAGSLRLFEAVSGSRFVEGRDYTLGEDGVTITFHTPVPSLVGVSADYKYPGTPMGPIEVAPFRAYNNIVPGCVIAFGDALAVGDRWAVMVSATREDAYEEYGGKWEHQVDLDVIARDPDAQMAIADRTAMFLLFNLRSYVIDQGIDIQNVSMAGETEEVYDENADDYFFNSAISMTLQTDWAAYVPLTLRMRSVMESIQALPSDLCPIPFRDPFFQLRFRHESIH